MNKEIKQKIKKQIEGYEYRINAMNYQCGTYTKATNIKIVTRNNTYIVYATMTLVWQLEGRTEKYNDCKYYLDAEDLHFLNQKEYEIRGL